MVFILHETFFISFNSKQTKLCFLLFVVSSSIHGAVDKFVCWCCRCCCCFFFGSFFLFRQTLSRHPVASIASISGILDAQASPIRPKQEDRRQRTGSKSEKDHDFRSIECYRLYWVSTHRSRLIATWPWVPLGSTSIYQVLLGFTGVYWVLLGFTGFYWVLLGFTGFYWVLRGFTGFIWVFIGFYWVLLGFSGF